MTVCLQRPVRVTLLLSVRSESSACDFKSKLRSHFFTLAFNSL